MEKCKHQTKADDLRISGLFHQPGYLQPHCRDDSWKHLLLFLNQQYSMNPKARDPKESLGRGEGSPPRNYVIFSSSTSRGNTDRERK